MKQLSLLLFTLLMYSYTIAQIKTAQAYYHYVISQLNKAMENDTILAQALSELNYQKADSARKFILNQIENSLSSLKQLEPYNHKEYSFKDATRDLLFFYKTVYENDYARLVEILSHAVYGVLPDTELNEFHEILTSMERREKIIVEEFEKSRKNFIKEYNIAMD